MASDEYNGLQPVAKGDTAAEMIVHCVATKARLRCPRRHYDGSAHPLVSDIRTFNCAASRTIGGWQAHTTSSWGTLAVLGLALAAVLRSLWRSLR